MIDGAGFREGGTAILAAALTERLVFMRDNTATPCGRQLKCTYRLAETTGDLIGFRWSRGSRLSYEFSLIIHADGVVV